MHKSHVLGALVGLGPRTAVVFRARRRPRVARARGAALDQHEFVVLDALALPRPLLAFLRGGRAARAGRAEVPGSEEEAEQTHPAAARVRVGPQGSKSSGFTRCYERRRAALAQPAAIGSAIVFFQWLDALCGARKAAVGVEKQAIFSYSPGF